MPNPYTVTIGATNKTLDIRAGTLRFTESLQSRGKISFNLVNDDVSYTPPKWAAVSVSKDGDVIAKGVVTRPPYGGVAGSTSVAVEATTTCGDLKTHWEKRRLSVTIAAGTMKAALQNAALADIYTDQGFTLDQPDNGPTVGPFEFVNVTLFDAIRAIADACDPIRVVELDLDDLEFRLIEPGDTAAPWDVTEDANGVCEDVDGDLTVEPNGALEANNVLVEFGSDEIRTVRDNFVFDGIEDTFDLSYPIVGPLPPGSTLVGFGRILVNGIYEGVGDIGAGFAWEYDPSGPSITRDAGAPAAGTGSIAYQAQFPQTVSASDPTSIGLIGQIDFRVPAPNLYSKTEAQRIADQTLAAMLGGPRIVRYPTTREGLRVGMTQHVESSIRDIDADCLITEITAEDRGGECLVYHITLVEGGLPPKPWQDTVRQLASPSTGGGGNTSPPLPGSTSGSSDDIGSGGDGFASALCGLKCVDFYLTDAQIKALPTTGVFVVPPPGENKIAVFLRAAGVVYKSGGAYTNINTDQGWVFTYGPTWSQGDASDYCGLDSREFMSWGPEPSNIVGTAPADVLRQYPDGIGGYANQVNQPIYLSAWNDGGNYGGGNASNFAAGRVWYFVLDVPPPPTVESACLTDVWEDDFESGTALASDYDGVQDMSKTAGVGFGGSQGLTGTGSDAEKYFGHVSKIVAKDNRRGCVTCKIKPDFAIDNGTYQIVRVSSTSDTGFAPQWNIELKTGSGGVSTGDVQFDVRGDPNIFSNVIADVLFDDTWVEFRIEWEMSSVSGGVRQADGWAKLFVNGALAYEVSGILLNDPNPSWATANPDNYWQLIQFSPKGLGDDLLIGKP